MPKLNLLLFLMLICSSVSSTFAQNSIWDGVYTEDQAARGLEAYSANCESCHADNLRGNSNTPSLIGMSFMFIWEGRSLEELYTKMREEMPSDRPASLSTESYQDLLAFLLKSNEFPAGKQPFSADSPALGKLTISPDNRAASQ